MELFAAIPVKKVRALHDEVIVSDMVFSERLSTGGIVLLNDNGKSEGIRPRWAKVYAIGPDHSDVKVGQWVCIEHGRWTRGANIRDDEGEKTIRKVDAKAIMMVSDEMPNDATMSDAIAVQKKG